MPALGKHKIIMLERENYCKNKKKYKYYASMILTSLQNAFMRSFGIRKFWCIREKRVGRIIRTINIMIPLFRPPCIRILCLQTEAKNNSVEEKYFFDIPAYFLRNCCASFWVGKIENVGYIYHNILSIKYLCRKE